MATYSIAIDVAVNLNSDVSITADGTTTTTIYTVPAGKTLRCNIISDNLVSSNGAGSITQAKLLIGGFDIRTTVASQSTGITVETKVNETYNLGAGTVVSSTVLISGAGGNTVNANADITIIGTLYTN